MGLEAFVCRFVKTSVFITFLASADSTRTHKEKMCYYSHTRGGGRVWSWICALAVVQQHIHRAAPQQLQQLVGNCLAQGQTGCSGCGEADQSIFKFSQKVLKARPSFTRLPAPLNHGVRPKKMAY